MSLSRIIAGVALAGLAYTSTGWSGEAARVAASAALIDVANTKLASAHKDLALAEEINQANLAALAAVKADLERQAAIAAKAQMAERKRAADLKTALKRIHNAPKSDDGPVAPVLRRELDDLRLNGVRPDGNSDAPANPTNENPIGADDGSG